MKVPGNRSMVPNWDFHYNFVQHFELIVLSKGWRQIKQIKKMSSGGTKQTIDVLSLVTNCFDLALKCDKNGMKTMKTKAGFINRMAMGILNTETIGILFTMLAIFDFLTQISTRSVSIAIVTSTFVHKTLLEPSTIEVILASFVKCFVLKDKLPHTSIVVTIRLETFVTFTIRCIVTVKPLTNDTFALANNTRATLFTK